MTIRKGEPWGSEQEVSSDIRVARDDADLAHMVFADVSCAGPGSDRPMLRVSSGDLLATVGGTASASSIAQVLPMDLGYVRIDEGEEHAFVAHVLVHKKAWSGQAMAVMNCAWVGDWYLGPRAHPNDGLLDVTTGQLSFRDRLMAQTRVKSGTHLPHPALKVQRVTSLVHTFDRPTPVHIDGVRTGRGERIEVRLESDVFNLVI